MISDLMSDCATSSSPETRKYERISLPLKGQLFDPGDQTEIGCELISLSGGGATLKSECEVPLGKHMVLYIEGFGRYEGTTVLHSGTPMLSFTIGQLKRKRLNEMLHKFVSRGLKVAGVHRDARSPFSFIGEIVRENGDRLPCDILDISLDGASLKTEGRPSIGEVIALGRSLGRVVRHHRYGIAIQYVRAVPPAN